MSQTTAKNPVVEIYEKAAAQVSATQTEGAEAWKRLVGEQAQQLAAAFAQLAAAQTWGAGEVKRAVDESARMMREAVDATFRLSAEWRRLALETTSRGVAAARPQA